MKKPWQWIKMLMAFLTYRWDKTDERIRWMLAQEKGMYCEGFRNGIAKFDPNYPPQEEPEVIGWNEFKKRWMEKNV